MFGEALLCLFDSVFGLFSDENQLWDQFSIFGRILRFYLKCAGISIDL